MKDPARMGPINRAIYDRDPEALIAAVYARTEYEPVEGHRFWTGSRREVGYGVVGRGAGNVFLVHRLVCWADNGMPGSLKTFDPVHHQCGQKSCAERSHLTPLSGAQNVLEASIRSYNFRRISALEEALRPFAPDHELLKMLPLRLGDEIVATASRESYSARALLRRQEKKAAYEARLDKNARFRFEQVIEVRNKMATGIRLMDALKATGVSRRVYEDWKGRMDVFRNQQATESRGPNRPGLVG